MRRVLAGNREKMTPSGPPQLRRRALTLSWGRVAAAALAGTVLVYGVAVGTRAGRQLDATLVELELDGPDRRIAVLGGLMINPLTVGVAAVVLSIIAARRHGLSQGVATAAVAVGAGAIATALKALLPLLDPVGGEARRALGEGFFPSGHTAAGMGLCLAAMVAAPNRQHPAVPALAALAATALACPHILTAWHHASDVLGALLVTTAWGAFVLGRSRPRPVSVLVHLRPPRRPWLIALAALAAFVALLELARLASVPVGPLHPLLVLTTVAVAVVAVLCTYAFARVLAAPASPTIRPQLRARSAADAHHVPADRVV